MVPVNNQYNMSKRKRKWIIFWILFHYQECKTGKYGLNCTKICGACLNNIDCHHVTGRCFSGCKKGWKDSEKCDDGIYFKYTSHFLTYY